MICTEAPMNPTSNVKQLAASTAFAAVLAASAGTAGLCLAAAAGAAPAPAGIGLRTLRDDPFRAAAGGLRAPAAHPIARAIALGSERRNS
jgi:hypothetical protein